MHKLLFLLLSSSFLHDEAVQNEADGNLSRWCRESSPRLNQPTVWNFLNHVRGAGRDLLFALCYRINMVPSMLVRSPNTDTLRERLSLLSHMMADPKFPFNNGMKNSFDTIALLVDKAYMEYLAQKDTEIS